MTASKRILHVDPSFDSGVFAGAARTSTMGEQWVGLLGAMGAFEAQLGLGHPPLRASVRVGEAQRALALREGFWSSSLEVDGLATARQLLHWYDTLRLEGWNGEGGDRLSSLHEALQGHLSAGHAERLEAIAAALPTLSEVTFSVQLHSTQLPRLFRATLNPLSPAGERVRERGIQPTLIRPHGPLAAAQALAHALAQTPDLPTLIINPDAVLDAALSRAHLPTLGTPHTTHDNAWAELLPLIIELGLSPADPERALELLSIPGGPIPGQLARELLEALHQDPAVNSAKWRDALTSADLDDARRVRVERIFTPDVVVGTQWPRPKLEARANLLQQWVQGRLAHAESEPLAAVAAQISLFLQLLKGMAASTLSMTQVRRLLEVSHGPAANPRGTQRQAGLYAVGAPGGVVAPIERIVWWNYVRSASPPERALPLTSTERRALEAAGITVPTATALARWRAAEWQRPFAHATKDLWLISPRHEENGDQASPHASWDQRLGSTPAPFLDAPPVTLKKRRSTSLPLPGPRREWNAAQHIPAREEESPSSIESALGCTLRWTLQYPGRLRAGLSGALPKEAQRAGTLAHHVLLDHVLKVDHANADAAAAYAGQIFDQRGPELASALFLPGATAERDGARRVAQQSARALFELTARGWMVVDTEVELRGAAFGTGFKGNADLILEKGNRRAVIDLKWSGHSYRRDSLQGGTAMQLASYAALVAQSGSPEPSVGYFILTTGALLSADPDLALAGTELTPDATPRDTFAAMTTEHAKVRELLEVGHLTAPGVVDGAEQKRTSLTEDGLQVQTPCGFCDFEGLCGRRYGREEAADEAED